MERVTDRVSYTVLLAVGAVCILAFLVIRLPRAIRADASPLGNDGPGYYSYLRSILFDGDLDFRDEYERLDWPVDYVTPTGLVTNFWSVGPAILWAPFYVTVHYLLVAAGGAGLEVSVDGYGYAHQSAACVATIVYVTAGCFLTYRVCRRYVSPYSSLLAVLGTFLASSLIHYTVSAPGSSHGVSFFSVSLFLFLWHPPRPRSHREWILLGLAAGLMTLVRWQNVLYLTMLAIEGIQAIRTAGAGRRGASLQQYVKGGVVVVLVGAAVFLPQMLAWNTLYGSPLAMPQGSGFWDPLHPNLVATLLSTNHGLYSWTPIMLLATVGLACLWIRDKHTTLAVLTPLLFLWYVNSATSDWWAHGSFGARRFVSATPLLALGMATLTESVVYRFRHGSLVMLATVSAMVGWNFLFELQYSLGFIPNDEAISWHELTIGKFEMVLELIERAVSRP